MNLFSWVLLETTGVRKGFLQPGLIYPQSGHPTRGNLGSVSFTISMLCNSSRQLVSEGKISLPGAWRLQQEGII